MKDSDKTKTQLIKELEKTRRCLSEMKSAAGKSLFSNISEEKDQIFRMITENVSDMIAILDLDGKRLYNSKSYKNILGDPEKLRGTDSFKEIHPDDREKVKKISRR